jgi:hypothetical protein
MDMPSAPYRDFWFMDMLGASNHDVGSSGSYGEGHG